MLTTTVPTTPLQIFCEFALYFVAIFKSIQGPDDACLGDLPAWVGWFLLNIFDEKMLTTTQPTTLLQIFCEGALYFVAIFKRILGPDDACLGDLPAWVGWFPPRPQESVPSYRPTTPLPQELHNPNQITIFNPETSSCSFFISSSSCPRVQCHRGW